MCAKGNSMRKQKEGRRIRGTRSGKIWRLKRGRNREGRRDRRTESERRSETERKRDRQIKTYKEREGEEAWKDEKDE